MQVRKDILEAFASGSVKTRDAYIALEHEWMHLETLAYMLAQEQRLCFEQASTGRNDAHSIASSDSSSDGELLVARNRLNGHTNGHTHSITQANGKSSGTGNGRSCVNGGSHSMSNGHTVNGHGNSLFGNGHVSSQMAKLVHIPAGHVTLGTDTDQSKNFVWDNEGPQQSPQHVGSFHMASRPISNAEYYKFAVEAKGYEQEEYWKAEDLACLKKATKLCPATWTVQVGSFPAWHCSVCFSSVTMTVSSSHVGTLF